MKSMRVVAVSFSIDGQVAEASKEGFVIVLNTDHIILIKDRKVLMRDGVVVEVQYKTRAMNMMEQS